MDSSWEGCFPEGHQEFHVAYQPAQAMFALILEWLGFLYAGYAGYRGWRQWYSRLTVVLLGLLAGVAALFWEPEPQGAPILIPLGTDLISVIAIRFSSQRTDAGRWAGRATIGVLLSALVLFACSYLMS
jgi:hypothetical protein